MGSTEDLVKLAVDRDYNALDNAWAQALEEVGGSSPLDPLFAAIDTLIRQDEGSRAASLLGLLAEALDGAGRPADALRALRAAADASPRPEALREDLVRRLRAVHGDRPGFDAYLKLAKLEDGGMPVKRALAQLDQFLDFPVGRFVRHGAGWGVGRVVAVDARSGAITIDFETRKGHQLPIDGAVQFLQRIPAEGLLARIFGDLDALRRLAAEDPAELLRLTVRSRGGSAKIDQIKADLIDKVVGKEGWSKLWTRAKKDLTHDPLVEIGGGSKPIITIRAAALRFADEVVAEIERATGFEAVYKAARRLFREIGDSGQVTEDERARCFAATQQKLEAFAAKVVGPRPGLAIAGALLVEDLAKGEEVRIPEAIAAVRIDLSLLVPSALDLAKLGEQSTLKRYLDGLRAAHPDGFAAAFAGALHETEKEVFQQLARTLKSAAPGLLAEALEGIALSSEPRAGALVELCKESFSGRLDGVEGAPSLHLLFERLLAFADRTERLRAGGHPDAPNIRTQLRAVLGVAGHGAVRSYFTHAPATSMRHTYARLMASPAIDDEIREVARSVVARFHPDVLAKPVKRYWEDEAMILTTRRGLQSLQTDFEDLINNKIPANRVAIGEARAHGDLSENAEYTAALEERDQLVARADRLKKELEKATLLDDIEIDGELVGPGVKVELIDQATSQPEIYTILGPWDADVDHHIISYTAPLAQGLLGRRVGEQAEISLPGGTQRVFKVMAISPVVQ